MRFVHSTTSITSAEGYLGAYRFADSPEWRLKVNGAARLAERDAVRAIQDVAGERVGELLAWGADVLGSAGIAVDLSRTYRSVMWADPEHRFRVWRNDEGGWSAVGKHGMTGSYPTREAAWTAARALAPRGIVRQ